MSLVQTIAFCIVLLVSSSLHAASFSVATVAELETALSTAELNGEDDTITIAAGTYSLTASLSYDSHEDKSLTITGVPGEEVILDVGGWDRILFVRTYTPNAPVTISGIIFTNGYVPEGDNGAGIFINIAHSDLTLENCQITNSFAGAFYFTNHGGGAYITAGVGANVLIRNCVFSNNTAKGLGGGIYLSVIDGNAILVNNTVISNHNKASIVEQGGGIYLRLYFNGAMAQFYNNILWGNTYAQGDGDLYVEDDGDGDNTGASINLSNNNYKQFNYNSASISSVTLVDNISQDPLFSSGHRLSVDSPSVDAGKAGVPNLPDFDIDGDPRSLDGNCNGTARPDMGADEYLLLPTISTSAITGITSTTASSGGDIVTEGGHPVTEKGVCWNTTANPTVADSCSNEGAGSVPYSSDLTGLTEGLDYYVRAYATTCEGSSYGEQKSFVTTRYPTVITTAISGVSSTKATGGGDVRGQGDAAVTTRGVCWSTTPNPLLSDNCTVDGSGAGQFTSLLSGLTLEQKYYVRAYARNNLGASYGGEVSFTARSQFPWPAFIPAISAGSRE